MNAMSEFRSPRVIWIFVCRVLASVLLVSGIWNVLNESHLSQEFAQYNSTLLFVGFLVEIIVSLAVLIKPEQLGVILPPLFAIYSVTSLYWWGTNKDRCPCLGPVSPGTFWMAIIDAVAVMLMCAIGHAKSTGWSGIKKQISKVSLFIVVVFNSFIAFAILGAESGLLSVDSQGMNLAVIRGSIVRGSAENRIRISLKNGGVVRQEGIRLTPTCDCTVLGEPILSELAPGESVTFDALVNLTNSSLETEMKPLSFQLSSKALSSRELTVQIPIVDLVTEITKDSVYEYWVDETPSIPFRTELKINSSVRVTSIQSSRTIDIVKSVINRNEGSQTVQIDWRPSTSWSGPSVVDSIGVEMSANFLASTTKYRHPLGIAKMRYVEPLASNGFLGTHDYTQECKMSMDVDVRGPLGASTADVLSVECDNPDVEVKCQKTVEGITKVMIESHSKIHRTPGIHEVSLRFLICDMGKPHSESLSIRWITL